jgi:hypothetical protein
MTDPLKTPTLIAQVPSQGCFVNGGEMCTICSSLFSMAMASGLFPSPTQCPRDILQNMLLHLMHHSSVIQTRWLQDPSSPMQNTAQRQVIEIVKFVLENNSMQLWTTGKIIECFGTVGVIPFSSSISEKDNDNKKNDKENNDRDNKDNKKEQEDNKKEQEKNDKEKSDKEKEQDNDNLDPINMVVVEMADLLNHHMKDGDTVSVTYFHHTISIHKSHKPSEKNDDESENGMIQCEWIVFDSLKGRLVHLDGFCANEVVAFCCSCCPSHAEPANSISTYYGVLFRKASSQSQAQSKDCSQ